MNFKIDLKIFAFIVLYYLTKQIEVYAMIMIFCLLHEIGHLLAGLMVGMKPILIKIMPFGFSISFKDDINGWNHKILKGNLMTLKRIIVAFAGPLTNIILIFIFLNLNLPEEQKKMILFSNLIIILFNMLPIYPLDGGRIIKGILHIYCGAKKSKIYTNDISIVTAIFLTIISSIAIYFYKNIAILFIIMFLWVLVLNENRKFKINIKVYENVEKYVDICR